MWYTSGMKKYIITLAIALLLASCATSELSEGFSSLSKVRLESIQAEETEPEPVAEAPEEPDFDSMTEEERYAYELEKSRELYELLEAYHAEIDPSYVPVPWETYWESLQSTQDEPEPVGEEIIPEVVEEAPAPIVEAVAAPSQKDSVTLAGNDLPMPLVWACMALFLACLFTICYIAKQRKESYWHRYRD